MDTDEIFNAALNELERRLKEERDPRNIITAFNMDEVQCLITATNESNLSDEWRNLLRAKLDMCQNALVRENIITIKVKVGDDV